MRRRCARPDATRFETVAETVFQRYAQVWKPQTLYVNRNYLRRQILSRFAGTQIADITRTPGLGVRVRPSGGLSFVLLRKTDGRSTRLSLGAVTSMRVDDARRQYHALMAKPDSEHPTKRTHKVPLFRNFVDGPWKDAQFPWYKPSTRRTVNNLLTSQLLPAFGVTPLDRITRHHVLHRFDAYSQTAPGGANHALRILRQILEFPIARSHISINPARDVTMNRRTALKARSRPSSGALFVFHSFIADLLRAPLDTSGTIDRTWVP